MFAPGCDPAHFGPTNTTPADALTIAESSDGTLSGGFGSGKPDITQNVWGTDRSTQQGNRVTIALHPQGWVSVIVYTGTLSGSTITGTAKHYDASCNFSLTYQGR